MRTSRSKRAMTEFGALLCVIILTGAISARAQQREQQQPDSTAADFARIAPAPELPDAIQPQPRMQTSAERLTLDDRFKIYVHSITTVEAALGPPFAAAIGQAENQPNEWGQGATGYGRRVASGYARMFISQTIRFGVAASDGEDPRFAPSDETGFWRRTRHAVARNFVSHTVGGTPMPAVSRIAGPYGAAFISNAWYPASRSTTGWALERGSTAFASSIGWSVFHEFWPDIRYKLHLGH